MEIIFIMITNRIYKLYRPYQTKLRPFNNLMTTTIYVNSINPKGKRTDKANVKEYLQILLQNVFQAGPSVETQTNVFAFVFRKSMIKKIMRSLEVLMPRPKAKMVAVR